MTSQEYKWDAVYDPLAVGCGQPASVLAENTFLLPKQGTALDLACGLGANAVFLANCGLSVLAWDLSGVAIRKLQAFADQKHLAIKAGQRYIDSGSLAGLGFDVIVVSRFLDRSLQDAIIEALNPGGLLFYQTFTRQQIPALSGPRLPSNPDYLLAETELLRSFDALSPVYYRDNGLVGDLASGLRNEAQFIGRKPL